MIKKECPDCRVGMIPVIYANPNIDPKEVGNPWKCPKCEFLFGYKDMSYLEHIEIVKDYPKEEEKMEKKKDGIKVPEDIKSRLENLSKQKSVPMKELQKKFSEIMKNDPECVAQKDSATKMRIASGLLMAEYLVSSGPQFVIRVRSFSAPRVTPKKKKRVANVYGISYKCNEDGEIDEDELEYTVISLWGDASENVNHLEKGKVYLASLIEDSEEPEWGRLLFSSNAKFELADKYEDKVESWKNFMKELNKMDIEVATNNIDQRISVDDCDLRVIRGTAMQVNVDKEEKKGTLHLNDGKSDIDILTFFPYSEADFGNGSEVGNWGTVIENDKGEIRFQCHFVEKIAPTPLTLKAKPVAMVPTGDIDESEEIDLGDEEDAKDRKDSED